MNRFAVIDTETTWGDAVMSIGVVIADWETFELVDKRYYILTPFKNTAGCTPTPFMSMASSQTLNAPGKRR